MKDNHKKILAVGGAAAVGLYLYMNRGGEESAGFGGGGGMLPIIGEVPESVGDTVYNLPTPVMEEDLFTGWGMADAPPKKAFDDVQAYDFFTGSVDIGGGEKIVGITKQMSDYVKSEKAGTTDLSGIAGTPASQYFGGTKKVEEKSTSFYAIPGSSIFEDIKRFVAADTETKGRYTRESLFANVQGRTESKISSAKSGAEFMRGLVGMKAKKPSASTAQSSKSGKEWSGGLTSTSKGSGVHFTKSGHGVMKKKAKTRRPGSPD